MKTADLKEFLQKYYAYDDSKSRQDGVAYLTLRNGEQAAVRVSSISSSAKSPVLIVRRDLAEWKKLDFSKAPYFILCGETQDGDSVHLKTALEERGLKDDDYAVSVELVEKPREENGKDIVVRGIDFKGILNEALSTPDIGIYRKHVEGNASNSCNIVLIRVKENGADTTRYLDAYFASSDTRVFHDYAISKAVPMFVPQNEAAVKEDDGEVWPHNLLIFGAPGTGKSHAIDEKVKKGMKYRRVTFYEDYSYERFVGAYLPETVKKTTSIEGSVEGAATQQVKLRSTTDRGIAYSFVPGVFLEMIADAWYDRANPYALVIEEINRANAAAVFGDFFQLLDREPDGKSKYEIALPPDMRSWLEERIRGKIDRDEKTGVFQNPDSDVEELNRHLEYWLDHFGLPENLYLWATMNSADQGVYPMDAAFKRRWSFRYMSTQGSRNDECRYLYIPWSLDGKEKRKYFVLWDDLKSAINDKMEDTGIVEEDRLLGPWYFQKSEVMQIYKFTCAADAERLTGELLDPITNKLFQYLRQDVFRNDPSLIFNKGFLTMSSLRFAMCNGEAINSILNIELRGDQLKEMPLDPGTTFEEAFEKVKAAFEKSAPGDMPDDAPGGAAGSVTIDEPGGAADSGDEMAETDG